MPWWKFALWNAAGGICWTTSIVLLGHFFGNSIHVVERILGLGGVIALIGAAVVALGFWRRHEHEKKAKLESRDPDLTPEP